MIVLYMGNGFACGRVAYTGCYENVSGAKLKAEICKKKYLLFFEITFLSLQYKYIKFLKNCAEIASTHLQHSVDDIRRF